MGAAGDLVIPESIPRLPVRTRPLLPQESPCRPSEQGNGRPVYDTATSTSTPRPEADGPHPYDTILGTQEMAPPVLKIATSTTSAPMPETPWLWNRTHRFQLRMRLEMPSTESGEQRAPSPGTECERENLAPERSKRWNIVEGKGMWRVEKKVRDFVDSILPSSALPPPSHPDKIGWGRRRGGDRNGQRSISDRGSMCALMPCALPQRT